MLVWSAGRTGDRVAKLVISVVPKKAKLRVGDRFLDCSPVFHAVQPSQTRAISSVGAERVAVLPDHNQRLLHQRLVWG